MDPRMIEQSRKGKVVIRRMERGDLRAVLRTHTEAFPRTRGTRLGYPFLRSMYLWFIKRHPGLALVAEVEGSVQGFAAGAVGGYGRALFRNSFPQIVWGLLSHPGLVVPPPTYRLASSYLAGLLPGRLEKSNVSTRDVRRETASLASIAVVPSCQGMGLGKRLLDAWEKEVMAGGWIHMSLSVESVNAPARALYQKSGWIPDTKESKTGSVSYWKKLEPLEAERARVRRAYSDRRLHYPNDYYASDNSANQMFRRSRVENSAILFAREGILPLGDRKILDVGFGAGGWIQDLLSWGARIDHVSGVELNEGKVSAARAAYPGADLRVADASELPWSDAVFDGAIASTLFTSILSDHVRAKIAREINRVLVPGGFLLWYDFRYDNPRNKDVKKVTERDLQVLFPGYEGERLLVTLLPPLARAFASSMPTVATAMERVPALRSHILALLKKPPATYAAAAP